MFMSNGEELTESEGRIRDLLGVLSSREKKRVREGENVCLWIKVSETLGNC